MSPLNPLFAIIVYGIALATAYVINIKSKAIQWSIRFENIDGLRGFLALGVFIHHATVWYAYLHTQRWKSPQSGLFNHLGQTSVSLFFMITAFLFVTKLLNAKEDKMDWKALYVSRLFRLVPMYLVSILVLIVIVLAISDWELKRGVVSFCKEVFLWGSFTMGGAPYINGSVYTSIINAGVVWSLPYEWLFYISLPVVSLLMLRKPSMLYLLISILLIGVFYKLKGMNEHHIFSFAGGAIAPFVIKYGSGRIDYNATGLSILALLCLVFITRFETSDNYLCKILIAVVFNLIALGNNMFGILKSSALKLLGEIGYSTYLIHGSILFTTMYLAIGLEKAADLSQTEYCLIVFMLTPILVSISFMTYTFIEKPGILFSKSITKK